MSLLTFERRIPVQDAIGFLRNLATTVAAGVPLSEALSLLQEDSPARLRPVVSHLRRQVEKGCSLAGAMATSPLGFPPIAVSLVEAGERSGTLERNLKESVSHIAKSRDLHRTVHGAMLYPALVLATLFAVGMGVGLYVLPMIIPLFQSLDIGLPAATRVLLWIALFFRDHGLQFLLAALIASLAAVSASRLWHVRYWIQRTALSVPYLGALQRQASLAQLSGTLSTLLTSGIPLADALPICAAATQSLPYRRLLLRCVPQIRNGSTLSESLKRDPLVPGMARGFVKLGEKTGSLSRNLQYLSGYYEEEVRYAAKNLGTVLEPMLLIIVGLLVGAMALAIITPIYRVTSSLS